MNELTYVYTNIKKEKCFYLAKGCGWSCKGGDTIRVTHPIDDAIHFDVYINYRTATIMFPSVMEQVDEFPGAVFDKDQNRVGSIDVTYRYYSDVTHPFEVNPITLNGITILTNKGLKGSVDLNISLTVGGTSYNKIVHVIVDN
jgi:hypothetical protein